MTRTTFLKYFKKVMECVNKDIEKEALRLFDCGTIDTKSYEDNYLLPKIILEVALTNTVREFMTLSDTAKKEVANLSKF